MRKAVAIILILMLAAGAAVFYYRDALRRAAEVAIKNIQNSNNDLAVLIDEIKEDIIAPAPLRIGGRPNQVELHENKIVAQTNIARYDNGLLLPLIENAKLTAAARAKAEDMFAKQYFEHVSPSGVSPGILVKNYGYEYVVVGENLILGNFSSEKEVVDHWMASPGHRANILNRRFAEIGVAMVKGQYKGETVWIGVQEFGLPLSACPQPEAAMKNQIEINKESLAVLEAAIESKRRQIDQTNQNSPHYNDMVDQYNALVGQYNALNDETKSLITRYNAQINAFNQCVAGK